MYNISVLSIHSSRPFILEFLLENLNLLSILLIVLLFLLYISIKAYFEKRKLLKNRISSFQQYEDELKISYGELSKSYYWKKPNGELGSLLHFEKSKKIILTNRIYEYSSFLGVRLEKEDIQIKKGMFKRNFSQKQYTLEIFVRHLVDWICDENINICCYDNDKLYSKVTNIQSNPERSIEIDFFVNDIKKTINDIVKITKLGL